MADTDKVDDFRQRLTEYLEAVTQQEVSVLSLKPIAGGASRDIWQVGAKIGEDEQQLVLRRDLASTISDRALERDQEFRVMKAAHESGVNVPRPRWYCLEPLILDAPFLVMDFAEGVSVGEQVVEQPELAEARKLLPEQMGVQLARIHAIDPDKQKLDFLWRPREGSSPAQEALTQLREVIRQVGEHNPVFQFGLRWLEQHMSHPRWKKRFCCTVTSKSAIFW